LWFIKIPTPMRRFHAPSVLEETELRCPLTVKG
jgi:hypothetical protein